MTTNPVSSCGCATTCGSPEIVETTSLSINTANLKESRFMIEKMDCPVEEGLIRTKLNTIAGIERLSFNLIQRKLTVNHSLPNQDVIEAALSEIGMQAVPIDGSSKTGSAKKVDKAVAIHRGRWWLIGFGGVAAVLSEVLALTSGNENSWPVIALALFAIITSGTETYKKGWIAIKNLNLNINALMSVAVTGAVIIGQWPEAGMVMVLFSLAEMIEAMSLDRARNAIQGLLEMAPERTTAKQKDGTWREVDTNTVAKGMLVRLRPGERIPLDGEVVSGRSSVNQAPITGESIPVEKTVGDRVFAGTINENGSFEYRVTATATHSTLARIIKAVEEAQGTRAPTQRFVDQFARVYTPIMFAIALLTAIVPPLFFNQEWMEWAYKALVLLVISCPCALVISTPVSVVSGLAAAARKGILIKGGVYLEEGHKLKVLALDKTGTLTLGKPEVTDVIPLNGTMEESLHLAASLAGRSDHPVSSSIAKYWVSRKKNGHLDEVTNFSAIPGRGVKGQVKGQTIYLGNHRLVEELGICDNTLEEVLGKLEREGKTAVAICSDRVPLAVIGVADRIRETTREAIDDLHALGVRTVMLTGDNQQTADAIAESVGIDDARGNLLPEDKLTTIDEQLTNYKTVGMVGDGINDAPALAKSTIGFAMGAAGTDTAIETADVALMDDDLRKIPRFILLSRRTGFILKQNIALALGVKALFFGLAMMGMATLWMAVFADMGTSLIVVFNGLRLLRN